MLLLDFDYDSAQWAELLAGADMPVYAELYAAHPYDQLAPCPTVGLEYGDTVLELLHEDEQAEWLAPVVGAELLDQVPEPAVTA